MLMGVVLPPTVAAQLSSDAYLVSLSVDSTVAQTKMTPAFDPEVTAYFVAAPSEGDMVTVNVRPTHSGATLRWIGRDADPNLPGHQVALTVGDTASVSVRVEAEDGETYSDWYGIAVARASNQEKGWRVYNDVLVEDVVDDPRLPSHHLDGVWADDSRVLTTSFRHDPFDQKLFAFNAADSSRRTSDEFVLSGSPGGGIWSDGTTLWAMDTDGTLRAYNLLDGSEISGLSTDVRPTDIAPIVTWRRRGASGRTVKPSGWWIKTRPRSLPSDCPGRRAVRAMTTTAVSPKRTSLWRLTTTPVGDHRREEHSYRRGGYVVGYKPT